MSALKTKKLIQMHNNFDSHLKGILKLRKTYFEHFTVFVEPLGMDNILPKKEPFSVPQFGQGPWIFNVSVSLHFY